MLHIKDATFVAIVNFSYYISYRGYTDKLDGIITEEFWAEKYNEWNNELSTLLRKIETNNNANHNYMELGIKLLKLVENLYLRYISLSDIEKSETLKLIFQNFYLDGEKTSYTYCNLTYRTRLN